MAGAATGTFKNAAQAIKAKGSAIGQAPASNSSLNGSSKKAVTGPRRVQLSLTHVDPWSIMKVSFMLSVAFGIMTIVAAAVVWFTLDAMHVFATIQDLVAKVVDTDNNSFTALIEYMKFSRAISMATVIAVANIILATALSTIGAFLYNITATLVGGVHVTLADE
ncbi:DUF3566 domain-containing protein [Actinomyces vulturis]|uniref:DUF3566 domain-containing protein n=1 Tax=Actinomyces vulturis TaxID=1857645 RepID=UPI00082D6134|nr:DUF3566 domain-containing protein [Actinomyces vulturis]